MKQAGTKLSHLNERGEARMVDVGGKRIVSREAIAEGRVRMSRSTLGLLVSGRLPKGDVLAVARVAGIMAAKRCGDLIPLCHPLALDAVEIDFDIPSVSESKGGVVHLGIRATCRITAQTGVEMEALSAVTLSALTIYDMCKAVDKAMVIEGVRVVSKSKGSGPRPDADFSSAPAPAGRGVKPAPRRRTRP
jgi:cyclic pyranopterin phosphate synthase